jgi:RNA polymerase sigma-70 factor (ECF subfamily)
MMRNPRNTAHDDAFEHVLARVARGDRDAFASLYDHVAGMVYGLARDITGDQARAEKATEDVLAEVWRTAPWFSPSEGSALSWIFSIARRQAASQAHAAGGDGRSPRDLAEVVTAITERTRPRLRAELAAGGPPAMPEVQRYALLLASYGGYDRKQIANLLGIPAAAVSAQLRDGLVQLQERTG